MALAIRTGIPPSVWMAEGVQTIDTAYEMISEAVNAERKAAGEAAGPGGPIMSG